MKFRKIMAAALAATMVFASTVPALAEEGSQTAQGSSTPVVNTNVFCVVLPTVKAGDLDFRLDPQDLIQKTVSGTSFAGYVEGSTFDSSAGGVYFKNSVINSTEGSIAYKNETQTMTAINKGSINVEIEVKAEMTGVPTQVSISATDSLSTASTPTMYMAIKKDTDKTPLAAVTGGALATVTGTLEGKPGNYVYKAKAGTKTDGSDVQYSYVIKDDVDNTTWDKYEFSLTGKINQYKYNATTPTQVDNTYDWDKLDGKFAPSIKVTWTIEKSQDSAQGFSGHILATEVQMKSSANTVIPTDGTAVTKVVTAAGKALVAKTDYKAPATENVVLLKDGAVSGWAGKKNMTLVVTFGDGTSEEILLKK